MTHKDYYTFFPISDAYYGLASSPTITKLYIFHVSLLLFHPSLSLAHEYHNECT